MITILKSFTKKFGVSLLSVAVLGLLIVPFGARGDVTSGVGYLKTKPLSPWSIMALRAANETVDATSLQSADGSSAIQLEAPIMALAAAGQDPRTYPSIDLVAKLKTFYTAGQIGEANTLNDDVFGILALSSAGEAVSSLEIAGAKQFLLSHQNADGGWPFAVGGTSDTNTTAMAASALLEAGVSPVDTAITNAANYLKNAQNNDGGFPYDPQSSYGTSSDASSDAWVISFVTKLGEDAHSWTKNGANPVDHLLSLQDQSGYFKFQDGSSEDFFSAVTTSYAVIALLNKSYPVGKIQMSQGVSVHYRIEGSAATVCTGNVVAVDALSLIQKAAAQCGFSYEIQQLSFGPYLSRINNDEAAGLIGWLYAVNYQSPQVGAADYNLSSGDDVLWYFGDFNWPLTKLTLSTEHASSGSAVVATVEKYENNGWTPLSGASVKAGNTTLTTGADGKANLSLSNGSYNVGASATGYVRANTIHLIVGEAATQGIGLSLTVGDGGTPPGNQTISFTLSTSSIGFGNLNVGATGSKTVTVTNTGQVTTLFEATVAGDTVFTDNLKVDSGMWRNFASTLAPAGVKETPVSITIPAGTTAGNKSGNLVFWATIAQ